MMKVNRLFLFIILAIILASCNSRQKQFIIEQQVKNYVENVRNIKSHSNQLFIFITGYASGCQPCEEGTLALIDSLLKFKCLSNYSKYIVISDKRKDTYRINLSDNFILLTDSQYSLQKLGIDFPDNFIIEFDNNLKTIYWETLVSGNFNKIYENYKNKSTY